MSHNDDYFKKKLEKAKAKYQNAVVQAQLAAEQVLNAKNIDQLKRGQYGYVVANANKSKYAAIICDLKVLIELKVS